MYGAPDFLLEISDSCSKLGVNEGKRGEVREERSFYEYVFVAKGNHLSATAYSFINKTALNA